MSKKIAVLHPSAAVAADLIKTNIPDQIPRIIKGLKRDPFVTSSKKAAIWVMVLTHNLGSIIAPDDNVYADLPDGEILWDEGTDHIEACFSEKGWAKTINE